MLKIFNDLQPFFEDCYRRINVREYAKLLKVSPPTASTTLHGYAKQGLLKREEDRRYLFFVANKESTLFVALSRMFWEMQLTDFIHYLEEKLPAPTIILFGSLAKAETGPGSDIDIAIIGKEKILEVAPFERRYRRKIQMVWCPSLWEMKPRELSNNIINGYVLRGRLVR